MHSTVDLENFFFKRLLTALDRLLGERESELSWFDLVDSHSGIPSLMKARAARMIGQIFSSTGSGSLFTLLDSIHHMPVSKYAFSISRLPRQTQHYIHNSLQGGGIIRQIDELYFDLLERFW